MTPMVARLSGLGRRRSKGETSHVAVTGSGSMAWTGQPFVDIFEP